MNIDKNKLILWCPHTNYLDHFIVVSSYIRLYQTRNTATAIAPNTQLTPPTDQPTASTAAATSTADAISPFRFVDQIKYPQQSIRAVSFAPSSASSSSPLLLAAGLLSGKLELLSFSHGDQRVLKEFDPRYQRTCHAVSWNPTYQQQVAIALDRVRSSPGVLVWDIDKRGMGTMQRGAGGGSAGGGGGGGASMTINSHHNQPLDTVTEALIGVSLSEASFSLAWLPASPHCLVVGTGFKVRSLPTCRCTAHNQQSSSSSVALVLNDTDVHSIRVLCLSCFASGDHTIYTNSTHTLTISLLVLTRNRVN